jgi:uncharacterized peroxidase-related enzyme
MFIVAPADSVETSKVYKSSAEANGFVMNLTKAWAWRPDVFSGFAVLRNQLTDQSKLSKRELAVLVCATASALGDSYCSLAWGRTLAQHADAVTAAAVISNSVEGALSERERVLAAWARKVVQDPNTTTASDIEVLRKAGLSELEIFEATVFVAFRQAFSAVNDALGISPDRQLYEQVPTEVKEVVTFGRAIVDA